MERAAKRPRLAHGQDSNRASQNTHHHHQESSRFDGTGIAIRDGTVQVQGDLYVNSSRAPETDDAISRRKQILESLRFEQIDARQLSIKKALSKTCRWFLKTKSYQRWSSRGRESSDDRFLWIKGKPGAGKSTLMRFLLEHNHSLASRSKSTEVVISFFFNARGESLEKSTVGLYRSLLLQLLEACPDMQQVLDTVRPGRPWDTDLLKDLFDKAVQALEETSIVCFVDALDECEEAQIRDMVQFLSDLIENGSRLHICFASRHYPNITISTGLSIVLENQDEHENDIAQYIDARLHLKQDKQAEEIHLELREKASGIFIWVVLVVEILNREYEAGRTFALRERLRQLPNDLHHLFRDILTRDNKDRDSLLLCIQWILFAKSPLTPVELYFALISGVEPAYLDQSHSEHYSDDSIRRFVLNNSKGLAEPTKSTNPRIQFIHESVRDFLLKEKGVYEIFPELQGNVIGQSQERLKQCCLTYMSMEGVANLKDSIPTTDSQFPFLAYANQGILYHADQAESNGLGQQDFLATFPHSRWVKHYNHLQKHLVRRYTPRVSLRYIMAEAGMSALIRVLPADRSCFDVEDEQYGLPILAAAAAKNHDTVLAMLELEARCLPNFSFEEFRSSHPPPHERLNTSSRNFAIDKRKAILPQLIRHGNDILCLFFLLLKDQIDPEGSRNSALISQALENGFIETAKLLIKRNAEILTTDTKRQAMLMQASRYGYSEIVELLLDHGADASAIENGVTPLYGALHYSRRPEVIKLLLDHGADASAIENGVTPLYWTLHNGGDLEVMKLLLDHGADASAIENGVTPLYWALHNGKDLEVIKLLLDYGADALAIENGVTPLYWALHNGKDLEVIKLLLDYGADASAIMTNGRTPLYGAVYNGKRLEVIKLLLDHGADASAIITGEASLLYWALYHGGDLEVIKLLLDHGADASAITTDGSTLLYWALHNGGDLDVIKLLLDHGADASAIMKDGSTPLYWTLHNGGDLDVIKLLLDHGADASAIENGVTPLHLASQLGNVELAGLLLHHGADASAITWNGTTPLHWASQLGNVELAELLLHHGADTSAPRGDGETPLHLASQLGIVELAKLLLDHGADISAITIYGATSLHWASQHGHVEVAKLLLHYGADVSAVTEIGATPLHRASQNGNIEVVRLLLDRGADISVAARNGEAPLLWAIRYKQTAVVKLLLDRGAYFPATRSSE